MHSLCKDTNKQHKDFCCWVNVAKNAEANQTRSHIDNNPYFLFTSIFNLQIFFNGTVDGCCWQQYKESAEGTRNSGRIWERKSSFPGMSKKLISLIYHIQLLIFCDDHQHDKNG